MWGNLLLPMIVQNSQEKWMRLNIISSLICVNHMIPNFLYMVIIININLYRCRQLKQAILKYCTWLILVYDNLTIFLFLIWQSFRDLKIPHNWFLCSMCFARHWIRCYGKLQWLCLLYYFLKVIRCLCPSKHLLYTVDFHLNGLWDHSLSKVNSLYE